MKNLIKNIPIYKSGYREFNMSLSMFILSVVFLTLKEATGLHWFSIPAIASMILCGLFFIAWTFVFYCRPPKDLL